MAASASGGTKSVVQAVERANELGVLTIVLTGTPGSVVTQVADRAILVDVPNKQRSPGIRTYQASIMGMLLLAMKVAGVISCS